MTTKLSRNDILKATQDYFLIHGKMPSIRQLGAELGCDPMAIYYYFSNKQALLEALCIELVGSLEITKKGRWPLPVQSFCEQYLDLLQRYPGLLHILLTMESNGPAQYFCQQLDEMLAGHFPNEKLTTVVHLIVDYVHGVALAEESQPERWREARQSFSRGLTWVLQQAL
ncbi:TetR family transcriptional regulator [Bacterioplanes sanyensis]|uniref:TetR/AcrR family transcriptional regulator n=1 Tax=Bacterioplanes sanyensis TaxID=1249553 RepID=UPI00167401D6|nr:TetR/AcrR family transcriptional regulator [Bacterioplanes sanyensis]GGY51407.1 TetR family transcriptional regulator [Bacterioplanes sanyensis]